MSEDDLIPTRKSLLSRLKNWEDNESWHDFFQTYWKLIYNFALARGLRPEEAEDVVQETVVAVAKHIPQFKYDPDKCAFKSWLLTVTRSRIANQFQKRARHGACLHAPIGDSPSQTPVIERAPDERARGWDAAWEEEWRRTLMESAVQRIKRRVSIEQFQMFDLFVLKGWPARDVARTLGVTMAHVYVAKHRVSKLLKREIATLEARGV